MINNLNLANDLKFQYSVNSPFPNIIIDNFFNEEILSTAVDELQRFGDWGYDPTDVVKGYQVNKQFTPWSEDSYKSYQELAPAATYVMHCLNHQTTLDFLQKLTGITDLIADNSWSGAGVHKILPGGKLSIHADYNWHHDLQLHRRINLLLYLNKNWQEEWGGDLELWERDLSARHVKIAPIFNRAVIFNITDDAYHGHPEPLNTPEGVCRYSFAAYYFTKDRPESEKSPPHYVLWGNI